MIDYLRALHGGVKPPPKPIGTEAYFDRVQVWFCWPLDELTLYRLEKACRGGIHSEITPSQFRVNGRTYHQKVELYRGTDDAFRLLPIGTHVNQAEFALDWNCASRTDLDETEVTFPLTTSRPWHGKKQRVFCYEGTNYDADGWSSNQITGYRLKEACKFTGEVGYWFHVEWHANNVRALRSIGIREPSDLIGFDFAAFWRRRLRLYGVDGGKLGCLRRNSCEGTRSRIVTREDRRIGVVLMGG